MTQRAIEVSFPIVEINRLAVPERNSFKPIYQMHKWFARRASCVFRAILLGCLKPAGTDIMAEFYKDHTHDPDTNDKTILDPFMGGGTTIVEALRLGCKVTGIDLNPVAWFIVKTEVEPADIDALRAAFDRLVERRVEWSDKSVRETLLEQYKTECPCCGNQDADIIYTFWVKSAICTSITCGKQVPLFSKYVLASRTPSIRYWRDVRCPKCKNRFDWELEPAALVGQTSLMQTDPSSGAGVGRSKARWAFSSEESVKCPWCDETVQPGPPKSRTPGKPSKPERKKVPVSVLLCPRCESVWQWRGELPPNVDCPACHNNFSPHSANVLDGGKFVCPSCGNREAIITSIRRLPDEELLPMHPYGIEGYCSKCNGGGADDNDGENENQIHLFGETSQLERGKGEQRLVHVCMISRNSGKFFKRISAADLTRYQKVCTTWEQKKTCLLYPQQMIHEGYNTNQMIKHHYQYWYQMFNPRQLLCIATILEAIREEPNSVDQEFLLSTIESLVDRNNMFCFYYDGRDTVQGMFSRHDFHPKLIMPETNVGGASVWRGTLGNLWERTIEGKVYAKHPYDRTLSEESSIFPSKESIYNGTFTLKCEDSRSLGFTDSGTVDFVITDPPYAGNVNYSELSDFFYVWLRLLLADKFTHFAPEQSPKAAEIVENEVQGKDIAYFKLGLKSVFQECYRVLKPEGLLAFTFHHREGSAWETVISAICESGFELEAAYPIHGEKESSLMLQETKGISYDLIHVCKKRDSNVTIEKRSWAGIRQEIRRRAREEIRSINQGRYGQEPLAPADINIVLIGKCLELYSRHYGAVVDHEGNEVTLHNALIEIRNMVDQLVQQEQPLPDELEDLDAESRVYLLTLCDHKEIKSDDVHKATRGILEPEDLIAAGLMIKGRAKGGRTYEVKQPAERFNDLLEAFGGETERVQPTLFGEPPALKTKHRTLFIDIVHLLMGLAEGGENLLPWLARFRGETPRLRAACEYLARRNPAFEPPLRKITNLIDPLPLFRQS